MGRDDFHFSLFEYSCVIRSNKCHVKCDFVCNLETSYLHEYMALFVM